MNCHHVGTIAQGVEIACVAQDDIEARGDTDVDVPSTASAIKAEPGMELV